MGSNPYDNNSIWHLLLVYPFSKSGREALPGMFGIHWEQPAPLPPPDIQYVTCCVAECPGLVATNGHCSQCGIRFAAYIICLSCGWKQGVLNADRFTFRCWNCKAEVADS